MPPISHIIHPLHRLSPYVGRLATHRAEALVRQLGRAGGNLVDPFCGSGTIPLEAWRANMHVVASDQSPYAIALTRAKLFPLLTLESALTQLNNLKGLVAKELTLVDLRTVPKWVRAFYHPETLREAIAWSMVLRRKRCWFLFGCFLNLLHHQRPGFLSFPASHATPYLRCKKYPLEDFPTLYEYRAVETRLIKKVTRTLRKDFGLNSQIDRVVRLSDAQKVVIKPASVDCVITSPPYMSGLAYARDNRLRLWFCGVGNWLDLEKQVTPARTAFVKLMNESGYLWQTWLRPKGFAAIVLGDIHQDKKRVDVALLVLDSIRRHAPLLSLVSCEDQSIPDEKRLIKGNAGTLTETTLIFRRR